MTKYPILSAREIISALKKLGFDVVKQRGSHIKLSRKTTSRKITTIVPSHKTVMAGTLKGILELAEVPLEEFVEKL